MKSCYWYGMRLRGFSPGAQPKVGFVERRDDPHGKYWDLLAYDHKLSDRECAAYDLDALYFGNEYVCVPISCEEVSSE